MAEEFSKPVEEGLRLTKRIYYGNDRLMLYAVIRAHCYVNAAAFVNVSGSWRLHCVCGSRTPRRPARAPSAMSCDSIP
ncbi:hypothetical protein JHK85_043337 [Glycine max]|nr:hypothetical protein JHK86_042707 [Glycine max]KAG4956957.1 hypothetical protein JHK85_043337 [Glycine max]